LLALQGLEAGMLVGIALCSVHFAFQYASSQLITFSAAPSRSNSMLPFRHQQLLSCLTRTNLRAVSIHGALCDHSPRALLCRDTAAYSNLGDSSTCPFLLNFTALCATSGYIFFGSMVEIGRRVRETASTLSGNTSIKDVLHASGLDEVSEPSLIGEFDKAVAFARRFVLLDLRHVTGIDATTASAVSMLRRSLGQRQVTLVLTGVSPHNDVGRMLIANDVISKDGAWETSDCCPAFSSMDAASYWYVAVEPKLHQGWQGAVQLYSGQCLASLCGLLCCKLCQRRRASFAGVRSTSCRWAAHFSPIWASSQHSARSTVALSISYDNSYRPSMPYNLNCIALMFHSG
jgi:MFS superfamily sulfate permease-like transporter